MFDQPRGMFVVDTQDTSSLGGLLGDYLRSVLSGQVAAGGPLGQNFYDPNRSFAQNVLDPRAVENATDIALGVAGGGLGTRVPSMQWFHGGREPFDPRRVGSEFYMTNDAAQAGHYARGAHLGGYGSGEPRVTAIKPKPGRVINVDDKLFDAMDNGDDLIEALTAIFKDARAGGARYVEYMHPNAVSEGEHLVRVSLFPGEDLIIKGAK